MGKVDQVIWLFMAYVVDNIVKNCTESQNKWLFRGVQKVEFFPKRLRFSIRKSPHVHTSLCYCRFKFSEKKSQSAARNSDPWLNISDTISICNLDQDSFGGEWKKSFQNMLIWRKNAPLVARLNLFIYLAKSPFTFIWPKFWKPIHFLPNIHTTKNQLFGPQKRAKIFCYFNISTCNWDFSHDRPDRQIFNCKLSSMPVVCDFFSIISKGSGWTMSREMSSADFYWYTNSLTCKVEFMHKAAHEEQIFFPI